MSLVQCFDLPQKLRHFYEAGAEAAPDMAFTRASELARRLGVTDRTITDWKNGDPSKNREGGYVQLDHLQRLSDLYARLTQGRTPSKAAFKLWTKATATRFRDGLFGPEMRGLEALLSRQDPTLDVSCERGAITFHMMEDGCEPILEAGDVALGVREKFCLHVQTPRIARQWSRAIVVLVEAPEGLFQFVPGGSHTGVVTQPSDKRPERIPPGDRGWWFSTGGRHRIVVVAMAAAEPPHIRSDTAIKRALDSPEVAALVEAILDPARTAGWAWGALTFHVT